MLTVVAAINHTQLSAIRRWFADNLWLITSGQDIFGAHWTRRKLTADTSRRERLVLLLRAADLGITDVSVTAGGDDIQLLHQGGGEQGAVPPRLLVPGIARHPRVRGHYGGVLRVREGRIARELRRWEASA